MEITYNKKGVFSLNNQHSITLANSFSPELLKVAKSVLIYTEHEYPYQNSELLKDFGGYVVRAPGEYEVGGVTILGVQIERKESNDKIALQTLYHIKDNDISFCYLCSSLDKIQTAHYGQIDDVDVLFLPILKDQKEQANAVLKNLEPKIIIPYSPTDDKKDIQDFCSSYGLAKTDPVSSYSLKKSDINPEEEKIILFA